MTAWARRTIGFLLVEFSASAFAHPTRLCITLSQKKIGPCLRLWARGRPYFLSSVSLANRGGWRATRRMTQVTLDRPRSAWLPGGPGAPGSGREASRPAPCVAPTRHLGLYAFDRGRTGPAPSGRRGCPRTARGRRLRTLRSQVPLPFPAFKTPPEGAPRRVDRDMSRLAKISPDVK